MNRKTVETGINGLKLKFNKVVLDHRGALCEIAPGGFDQEFFKNGIKNVYASIATKKGVPRAGHYHLKTTENHFTLSGTAFWICKDLNRNSPTFGKIFSIILGFDEPEIKTDLPTYIIKEQNFPQIFIPTGVYHVYWPVTDKPVLVLSFASHLYEKEDHIHPDQEELGDVSGVAEKYGLSL